MSKLNFELQLNSITYMPERYKAVLMLNDGMCKALPHDSDQSIEDFKSECEEMARIYKSFLTTK